METQAMNTQIHRDGESGHIPFRSGRFFNIGGSWYFSCREGMDRGPYDTRSLAETALFEHIKHCGEISH